MRLLCVLVWPLISISALSNAVYAGAWPVDKGQGQLIGTVLNSSASKLLSFDDTQSDRLVVYNKVEANLYAEHGLTDKWTLVASSRFQDVSSNYDVSSTLVDDGLYVERDVSEDAFKGFGASALGLRRTLWQDDLRVLSGQVTAFFASDGENLPQARFGDGGMSVELRGLAGQSFKIGPHWAFAEAQLGYRMREMGQPNQTHLDVTVGSYIRSNVQLIGQIFMTKGQGATDEGLNFERAQYQLMANYAKTYDANYHVGLGKTFYGQNTVEDATLFVGLTQRY